MTVVPLVRIGGSIAATVARDLGSDSSLQKLTENQRK